MKTSARTLTTVAAVAALALAGACSSDDNGSDDSGDPQAAPDQVTYATAFGAFGREAYVWAALDQGFFEEENIEVEIVPGQGTGNNITQTVEGQIDFSIADLTGAMINYAAQPHDADASSGFVVVAAIQQLSLTGVMTLDDRGFTSPADLEGTTLAATVGSVNEMLMPAYAAAAGFDDSDIEWVHADAPQLPSLLAQDTVDAIGQFAVGVPAIEAQAEGRSAVVFPYSDVLTDLYGNALITSSDLVEENPDLVERFTRALLRGLEWSVQNPDEAGEILVEYEPSQNAEVAAEELRLMEPYVLGGGDVQIGTLEEERLMRNIALLEGVGEIEPWPVSGEVGPMVSYDFVSQG